jgi:formate hydrogenlyase subunit 3/multisubunit Na+/H+ antiporter MnhD subunit
MIFYEDSELIGFILKITFIILFSGIVLIPFVQIRIKPIVSIISVLSIAFLTGILAVNCLKSGSFEYVLNGGSFFGDIPLRIDGLSAWFILVINFTSVTGVIYGTGYLKKSIAEPQLITSHWISYLLFHASMLAVTIVQHSIVFLISWEVMSLSSLFLVIFEHTNPKVLKAGINYLVQMHLSVILLTVAFIWVYFKTGSFDFKTMGLFFGSNSNIWLFLLFFAGFGLKAGFIGLHTWLPHAHPAAPSHISGVMSGVIVKMGIYGIFRIITFLKADYIILGEIVLTLSLVTGLFGIMNAAVHRDFKRMLAYCTIENIGIIGIGIGLGLIGIGKQQNLLVFFGFGGALLHVLNHSLFKSLLFFSAGSVYRQTHTRDMDKLGGLIKTMPKTAALFLFGALAIGGLPPFNGFISEFLIYSGILEGFNSAGIALITLMILTFAGLGIIGGISILAFTKTFGTIFLGSPRQEQDHLPEEVPAIMLLPQYMITIAMIGIAFFPGLLISILEKVMNPITGPNIRFDTGALAGYTDVMKNISLASVIFIALTGVLLFLRWYFMRKTEVTVSSTWGCGYSALDPRMQYTGKSFSKSFGKLMNFTLIEKKGYDEIERTDTFPGKRRYRSFYLDIIEKGIIDPSVGWITKFINLFQFIQNGKIQAYVIYGIIFILAVFLGTVLNLWH